MANNPNDPNNQNINQPKIDTNQPQQSRQAGTGFTNIGRILGANVGAGQKLAGRIGGSIAGQGQRVRQGLGQAQQQFETGFQQARQGALANIQAGQALAKQPGETDEAYEARIASANTDFGKVGQGVKSAAYTGPMGFENPNVLLSQAQSAGKLGAFTRSGIGQGILARQYGASRGASYGAGQNVLDQMFLSQDPTAQKTLQQARQSVTGLGKEIGQASEAAMKSAQSTQANIEQEKAKTLGNLQSSVKGVVERGQKAAEEFYSDRDRLNQLMTAKKTVNEQGIPIYTDQQGNVINVSEKDRQLIQNADKFGLRANEIMLPGYEGYSDITKGVLQQIANIGGKTNVGSLKYTPEQQAAVKNLAAITGQQVPESTFDTNVFNIGAQNIGEKVQSFGDYETERQKAEAKLKEGQKFNNLSNRYNQLLADKGKIPWFLSPADRENMAFLMAGGELGMNRAEIDQIAGKFGTKGQVLDWVRGEGSRLTSEAQPYLDQKQVSLTNYLKDLYTT